MRRRVLSMLVLLAAASLGAAPEGSDLSKLQGCWETSVGRRREISVTIEIKGNDVAATVTPKVGPKLRVSGELQVDEAASPRSLDWVKFSTLDGQEIPRLLSIYRLEGDRLVVRSGGFNDSRPKVFEKGGEGVWSEVVVFTRPAAPKPDAVTSNP